MSGVLFSAASTLHSDLFRPVSKTSHHVCGPIPPGDEMLRVFMNQRDVVRLAHFVQQMQTLMEHSQEAPTNYQSY